MSTGDVAATIIAHTPNDKGMVLNISPPKLTISTSPTSMVNSIHEKVADERMAANAEPPLRNDFTLNMFQN